MAPQILPLWPCHDAVPWGKADRRRMPRYGSVGDQLSRLRVFVLLALAQQVPSWSCTPGARVLGINVQVLLRLAQRISNEFVSLCEPCGHAQHGYTSRMASGGAGSSLHFSTLSMSFAPCLPLPQQAVEPTLLLLAQVASCRLNFASAPGQTADSFS